MNSPNMYITSGGAIHNEIQMYPEYGNAYFTGYIQVAGSWNACGAETYSPNDDYTEICSSLEGNELFHVLINLGNPDYSYVFF